MPTPPTGAQHVIAAHGYRAVVTESGGTLRELAHDGRDLVDGFPRSVAPFGGRGQQLVPWPNRIEDGAYEFGGSSHQLPLSEPARRNASHGLVRWTSWSVRSHADDEVVLGYRLMAQTGYPWTLEVEVRYALDAQGLTVTQSATNLGDEPAPYAAGQHPYLAAGPGPVDDWQLTLPASTRVLADPDRLLPTGIEDVTGTAYDFREPRSIGTLQLDDAFTDLVRDAEGRATARLEGDHALELWVDRAHGWLQVYSADDAGRTARRSLAIEPMTAPANAFRSGEGLQRLEPGQQVASSWGLRAG